MAERDVKEIAQDVGQFDPIIEDEIRRGWRVISVPTEVIADMKENEIAPFAHVRMTRLNMAKRRKITELVQRAYQRDLMDKELLSNAQVMRLVVERGEWSEELDTRLKDLGERTTSNMTSLYQEGVARSHEWAEELRDHTDTILKIIDASDKTEAEKAELERRFLRWQQYTSDRQADYVDAFKADCEAWGGVYYPDKDLGWLQDNLPTIEAVDLLEDVQAIVERIFQYLQLVRERSEYEELRVKRLRIFANTVESRRDNAEEMARLFHTTERCTAEGTPAGPVVVEFDKLYEFPDPLLEFLIEEQFFFHNAISDETRKFLQTFGFTRAEPEKTMTEPTPPSPVEVSATPSSGISGSPPPSAELPAAPNVSTVSPQSTATPSSSSAATVPTT